MGSKQLLNDIRVILVEDDLMVQEVNRMFVNQISGFQVEGLANNGIEGRKLIKKTNPDLVLLDVFMPEEDGLVTIAKLREEDEDVDIIAITAANDGDTIKKLLRHGVVDYIVKPFTFERLKQALTKYRQLHTTLNDQKRFSQELLDQVTVWESDTTDAKVEDHLPKGLHRKTLNQVIIKLKNAEHQKSAEQIAVDAGLARVTVRRYLQYLEEKGDVSMTMNYGTIGRPVQQYVWVREREV